jgi:hypothetical protein
MGFLSTFMGLPHSDLIERGQPGRGLILDLMHTGRKIPTEDGIEESICVFILEVRRPGERAFYTTTRQRFPWRDLDQIETGATLVAVRVDPRQRTRTTIVWNAPLIFAPDQPSHAHRDAAVS